MPEPIRIERAAIRTCAVEIRAVKIDGKQMTLAVFRQIGIEPIIPADRLELQGTPWGWVRYEGVWLLWQKGGELRRCRLASSYDFGYWPFAHDNFITANYREIGPANRHPANEASAVVAERLNRVQRELLSLDQLFIAV